MSNLDVKQNFDSNSVNSDINTRDNGIGNKEEVILSDEERQKVTQLKDQGNSNFKAGQFESAIQCYLSALELCQESENCIRTILFSNLAAAKDHLGLPDEAIEFCSKALSLNDKHTKALIRRAQLYRKCDKLDESLADFEQYLQLVPVDDNVKLIIRELNVQIEQRNEKLKTEMLGKLKDLGNIVLKPFGLSTENFQLVKNSENGSYSVNFQNNNK